MSSSEQVEARLREIGAGAARARSELDRLIGQVEALRSSLETAAETPPVPEPTPPTEPEPTPPPEAADGDSGAARLVAMKLAVDGTSREEIASQLDAKFGSADRAAVLDEVLARAGR
ncbi:MAG: hypothetical protein ACXWEF_06345 [Solirubrobacterales bacterium]